MAADVDEDELGQGRQRRHAGHFRRTAAAVMVGNAHVVKADIAASNGVIHVIDTVLLPKDR